MGSTKEKLARVAQTKEEIRQAIISKKMDVPTTTKFRDYPAKIRGIYPDALFLQDCNLLKNTPIQLGGNNESVHSITYGNGIYLMVSGDSASSGRYHYRVGNEATGWDATQRNFAGATMHFTNVIFAQNMFVCFGYLNDGTIRCYRSTNGMNWAHVDVRISGLGEIVSILHDGKKFMAMGHDGSRTTYILKSNDAITWSLDWKGSPYNRAVVYNNFGYLPSTNTYVMNGENKNFVYTNRPNEYWWESCNLGDLSSDIDFGYAKFLMTDRIIACRPRYTGSYSGNDYLCWSTDGVNWSNMSQCSELYGLLKNGDYYYAYIYYRDSYYHPAPSYYVYRSNDPATLFNYGNYIDVGNEMFGNICVADNKLLSWRESYDSSSNRRTAYLKTSFDGYAFYPDITKKIVDVNDRDVSNKVMQELRGISALSLQAAYEAGVNSI